MRATSHEVRRKVGTRDDERQANPLIDPFSLCLPVDDNDGRKRTEGHGFRGTGSDRRRRSDRCLTLLPFSCCQSSRTDPFRWEGIVTTSPLTFPRFPLLFHVFAAVIYLLFLFSRSIPCHETHPSIDLPVTTTRTVSGSLFVSLSFPPTCLHFVRKADASSPPKERLIQFLVSRTGEDVRETLPDIPATHFPRKRQLAFEFPCQKDVSSELR